MAHSVHHESTSTALLLSGVPVPLDIILCIFACCDIASVVSVAQTCRDLHGLAFTKIVWLDLLDDLRRRMILDRNCTPDLQILSMAEMIGVVKRLNTGPQTWSPGELDSVAEMSRRITLDPAIKQEDSYRNITKLLRSGRYVLFTNSGRLECWSVVGGILVWTHTSAIQDIEVHEFTAEETETNVTIMLCIRTSPNNAANWNYVEMVNLDFQTGTHTSLFIARGPDSEHNNVFSDPAICGALAVVRMAVDLGENLHMIVNWEENLYFILDGVNGDPELPLYVALFPGHLLLNEGGDQLYLISGDGLQTYWAPTIGPAGPAPSSLVSVEDVPRLSTFDAFEDEDFGEVYVHKSVIRAGDYSVWIYGTNHVDKPALLSYRLSFSTNGEHEWYRRTGSVVEPEDLGAFAQFVTYCGHRVYTGSYQAPVYTILSAASTSPGTVRVALPQIAGGQHVDIAPYSGALTYSTDSAVVIEYYQ
ncbi:hypothetical protein MSAN_01738700 [Mycena sanguinolenta]|uniref:F-box domain-containing protein n=1 Tax=Mycena sanguinolenta TaxID=230812 RepID=A0A8H6XZ89_9AGAR|nr:hypothetical protein MSAN_01738700 [Mycena sanguinolenta]